LSPRLCAAFFLHVYLLVHSSAKEILVARLCEAAGELQIKLKRPVSLDEAMEQLLKERKLRASDFAGAWNMSDEEEIKIFNNLRRLWKHWSFREG
jgi:predicted CopG family antitoxin